MCFCHGFNVGHDVSGERGNFWAGHVYVQGHDLAGGRKPTVFVVQFLEDVETLGVVIYQVKGRINFLAGMQFPYVCDMGFGGICGQLPRFDILQIDAQFGQTLVYSAVKQDIVIGHVEVAIVIGPLGFDPHEGRAGQR